MKYHVVFLMLSSKRYMVNTLFLVNRLGMVMKYLTLIKLDMKNKYFLSEHFLCNFMQIEHSAHGTLVVTWNYPLQCVMQNGKIKYILCNAKG